MATKFNNLILSMKGSGKLGREQSLMARLAKERNIAVVVASEKMMEREKVELDRSSLVMGSIPFVMHALRRLGVALPEHDPYPSVLTPWLHRRIWHEPSLRTVLQRIDSGERLFVKPADGWKRFTGFVAEFRDDYRFGGYSNSRAVWVAEPLDFVSEWRVYVVNGQIQDIRYADHGGDRNVRPDERRITAALHAFTLSGSAPAGYVIDFGVTRAGDTALVEVNDGFGFGAYDGLPAEIYWHVTETRWAELLGKH